MKEQQNKDEFKYEIQNDTVYVLVDTDEQTILGVFTTSELAESAKEQLIRVESHNDDDYDEDEDNYYDEMYEIREYSLNMLDM